MNSDGEKDSQPTSIFSNIDIPEQTFLPSPDGSQFMIMNDWGIGNVFNADTGKIDQLPSNFGFYAELFFNWYPNNKMILIRANLGSLWLADLSSGVYRILAVPGYGSVDGAASSPDGTKIVYSLGGGLSSPSIWIVNADGRDARLLAKLTEEASFFSWSPDGKQFVFLSDGWTVMSADGSNSRQLGYFGIPPALNHLSGHPIVLGL